MKDALRRALEAEPDVAYALLFGSAARGTAHAHSDVDVAVGLNPAASRDVTRLGDLIAALSRAAKRPVDVVLLDEAGPALAYRVFRDGEVLSVRDRDALVKRKARAILDYLDFKPVEDRCVAGVLRAAASRGR
jgi:hypothetical protein